MSSMELCSLGKLWTKLQQNSIPFHNQFDLMGHAVYITFLDSSVLAFITVWLFVNSLWMHAH